jgi:hypothetical protein
MLSENMGGWIGGQADYVMVPYADFNLLKFPDKAQAMEKIRDLTWHLGYYSELQMPGSKPGEHRGGRKRGTPNKLTARRVEEVARSGKRPPAENLW